MGDSAQADNHHKNRGFSKLVNPGDSVDLEGLVAYGLYKQEKLEFIDAGDHPDEEIDRYYERLTDSTVKRLRSAAKQHLVDFANETVDEQTPTILAEHGDDRFDMVLSCIVEEVIPQMKKHITDRTRPLGMIFTNLVAWAITVIITAALTTVLLYNEVKDVLDKLDKVVS